MATIANLAVSLTAKTGKFESGMRKAGRVASGFAGKLKGMVTGLGGVASALAGIAGAASLTYMVKQSMDAIDVTAKLSDELGITTERLVGYQYAAGLSGTSNETLTKGFQRLIRRLGEAKQGYGEGVKALEALGFKAEELTKLNAADALEKISDRIREVPGAAERAAAAYALFGRQGQELMNFLLIGSEGFKAIQKDAEATGQTFSRIDAAQVEAANDAMLSMQRLIGGISNTLAIELAPYLTAGLKKLQDWASAGGGMGAKVSGAFQWIAESAAWVSDVFSLVKSAWYGVQGAILNGIGAIAFQWQPLIDMIAETAELFGVIGSADAFKNIDRDLMKLSSEAFNKSAESFSDFLNEKTSKSVTAYFNEIKKRAEETAKETVDAVNKLNSGTGKMPFSAAGESSGKGVGDTFKTLNLNRMSIAGLTGKPQEVRARGVEEKLDKIITVLGGQVFYGRVGY